HELRGAAAKDRGDLGGDHAAEEVTDQMRGREPERIEELIVREHQVVDVVEGLDAARARRAGMQWRVHAEPLRERREKRRPRVGPVERVEVDERRTRATRQYPKRHRAVADRDGPLLSLLHDRAPDGHQRSSYPGHTSRTCGITSRAKRSMFRIASS